MHIRVFEIEAGVQCSQTTRTMQYVAGAVQIKVYDDEEGVRKAEVERLGGAAHFAAFYERLKDVKEHYRRVGTLETTQPPDEEAVLDSQARLALCLALAMMVVLVPALCSFAGRLANVCI